MRPQPGDFGVVATYGNLRGRLVAAAIQYGTDSGYNHAITCLGDGLIGEAQPGGYLVRPMPYHPDQVIWSTTRLPEHLQPSAAQRAAIVQASLSFEGIPYSWLDIALVALAQERLGTRIDPAVPIEQQPFPWKQALTRVRDSSHMICSQAVDLGWHLAGIQLFDDGRFPGLVSPGDLYRLLTAPAAAA